MYDVIIIGSGPAGLSAAIYAGRAKFDTLIIEEKPMSGGQIVNTSEVDNYPGLPGVGGFELAQKMREHAKKRASSNATSPPPATATVRFRKNAPSQVAQYETPIPVSLSSPGTPSFR